MDDPAVWTSRPLLGFLLRVRARAMWNRFNQAVQEAPVRLSAAIILMGVIWIGLYQLFNLVFGQFDRTPLEATVAIPLVLNFFFVAMLGLLTFSNAIIAYGALFGKKEAAYLLSSPITPLDVVTLKYLESLVFSSWSLILLGLPLMVAMADRTDSPVFYVLFLGFFLAFIPIPGALGLLLAWMSARFFPRRVSRVASVVGGAVMIALIVWGVRSLRLGDMMVEKWLSSFLSRMSFVQSAFLPNQWVSSGIDHALNQAFAESALYLGVTIANAIFLSWVAVRFVARHFSSASDRATAGQSGRQRSAATASGGPAGLVFFYLPLPLRLIAAKDLRTFMRDPLQWTQLVILFGLLGLYLTNMPTLRLTFEGSDIFAFIPFLNLCAVSLILATFTCRFVFPLLSLEGQQLWLLGLLPTPRSHVLLAKLAFAMTVTLLVALGAMSTATFMLGLDVKWWMIYLGVTVAICYALCGFSVGIGARMPMFHEENVARIANGLGGTTNLLASTALVAVVLAVVGAATWQSRNLSLSHLPATPDVPLCIAAATIAIVAGTIALIIGARHFNRVEI